MFNNSTSYVVFAAHPHRFALPIGNILRIIRAVAVTRLPDATAPVVGVALIRGRQLPVVSVHEWLGGPARAIAESDQFVIAQVGGRTAVLVVDAVAGRLDDPALLDQLGESGGPARVSGAIRCADGLILVTDLAPLLARVAGPPESAVAHRVSP
jgi:purine-binding chemotaxis protein CheW